MFKNYLISSVSLALLIMVQTSYAVVITQLNGLSEFNSTTISSQDFESTINSSVFTFDASASRFTSASATSGVTSSGAWTLAEFPAQDPLTAVFSSDVFEVGMFFGNDVLLSSFVATLSVFDAANVLLGSVTVAPNGNDFADQFIGLRSDTAIRSMNMSYGGATCCAIVIDDFTVGLDNVNVPEPTTLALLSLGLFGLGFNRRKRLQ